jgi:uncharacterized protein (DUF1778 family)
MQMSAKIRKTKQLVVRLTEEEHWLITMAAKYSQRTVSDWTRLAIVDAASCELEKEKGWIGATAKRMKPPRKS